MSLSPLAPVAVPPMLDDLIPEIVATCPECGGRLRLTEDFDPDENEPPSLECENEPELDSEEEDQHSYWQSEWEPTGRKVAAYLRALPRRCAPH